MFTFRNLLKITIICLGVTYLIAPTAKAQFTFVEEADMAEETRGMSQAELQAYYMKKQREKEDAAERGSDLRKWYMAKKAQLNINYNTQEDKDKIAAGKKEWEAKKATMTLEEFKKAFNAWRFAPQPFTKLNPETATDADVIAAAREANVKSEVDDYIEDLIDDWDKDEDREKLANRKPEPAPQPEPEPAPQPEPEPTPAPQPEPASTTQTTPAEATVNMDLKEIPAAQMPTPGAVAELPTTMTQTVTTNDNGKITQETSSGSVKQDTPDGAGIKTSDSSNTEAVQAADTSSEKKSETEAEKKEQEEDEKNEQYTGVYKDRQLIPNVMAMHCKINAEDVVNDMSKLEGCIRQYISEMNNDNATEAQVGREDYNTLRYSVLNDLLATAITKAASVNGYEETMNKYAEATSESETKFDTEAALSNTQAFSTDVMNSIRELYVKVLTNEAIEGFNTIDAKAIADLEVETTPKAKSVQAMAKKGSTVTTQAETKVTVGEDEPQGEDKSAADVVTTPAEEAAAEPATPAVVNAESDAEIKKKLSDYSPWANLYPHHMNANVKNVSDGALERDANGIRDMINYLEKQPPEKQTEYVKSSIERYKKMLEIAENAQKERAQTAQAQAQTEPATAPAAQAAQTQPATTSQSTGDSKYANMSDENIEDAINAALEKESELENASSEEDKEKRRAYKKERRALEAELKRREEDKLYHPEKLSGKELTEAEARVKGRIEQIARDIAEGRTIDKAEQQRYHDALDKIQEEARRRMKAR